MFFVDYPACSSGCGGAAGSCACKVPLTQPCTCDPFSTGAFCNIYSTRSLHLLPVSSLPSSNFPVTFYNLLCIFFLFSLQIIARHLIFAMQHGIACTISNTTLHVVILMLLVQVCHPLLVFLSICLLPPHVLMYLSFPFCR